jgi:hypothetical protein
LPVDDDAPPVAADLDVPPGVGSLGGAGFSKLGSLKLGPVKLGDDAAPSVDRSIVDSSAAGSGAAGSSVDRSMVDSSAVWSRGDPSLGAGTSGRPQLAQKRAESTLYVSQCGQCKVVLPHSWSAQPLVWSRCGHGVVTATVASRSSWHADPTGFPCRTPSMRHHGRSVRIDIIEEFWP